MCDLCKLTGGSSFHSSQRAFACKVCGDIVECALQPAADFFDIVLLDNQRRSEYQPIADQTQDQSVARCRGLNSGADLEGAVEWGSFFTVSHQFHPEDEPDSSHVADQRMTLQPAEGRLQNRAEPLSAGDDADLFVDFQHFKRDRGGHRMARIGEAVAKLPNLSDCLSIAS